MTSDFIRKSIERFYLKVIKRKSFKEIVKCTDRVVDNSFYLPKLNGFISEKCEQVKEKVKEKLTENVIEGILLAFVLATALILDLNCLPFLLGFFSLFYILGSPNGMVGKVLFYGAFLGLDYLFWQLIDIDMSSSIKNGSVVRIPSRIAFESWILLNMYAFKFGETYYKENDIIKDGIRTGSRVFSLFAHLFMWIGLYINIDNFDLIFTFFILSLIYSSNKCANDPFNFQNLSNLLLFVALMSKSYDYTTIMHFGAYFLIYRRHAKNANESKLETDRLHHFNDKWLLAIVFNALFVQFVLKVGLSISIYCWIAIFVLGFNDEGYKYLVSTVCGFFVKMYRKIFPRVVKLSRANRHLMNRRNDRLAMENQARNDSDTDNSIPSKSMIEAFLTNDFLVDLTVFVCTMLKMVSIEFCLFESGTITIITGLICICYYEHKHKNIENAGNAWNNKVGNALEKAGTVISNVAEKTGIPQKIHRIKCADMEYKKITQKVESELENYENKSFAQRKLRPIGKTASWVLFFHHVPVYFILQYIFACSGIFPERELGNCTALVLVFFPFSILLSGDEDKESAKDREISGRYQWYLINSFVSWIFRVTGLSYVWSFVKPAVNWICCKLHSRFFEKSEEQEEHGEKDDEENGKVKKQKNTLLNPRSILALARKVKNMVIKKNLAQNEAPQIPSNSSDSENEILLVSSGFKNAPIVKLTRVQEFKKVSFRSLSFEILLAQRKENFGDFEVPNLQSNYRVIPLNDVWLPKKVKNLMKLDKLDEETLKSKSILQTLSNNAVELDDVLKKGRDLLCLEWAQEKINAKISIFENATLNFIEFDQDTKIMKGRLRLLIENLHENEEEKSKKRSIGEGDLLAFKFHGRENFIGIGFAKVENFNENVIEMSTIIKSPNEDSGKMVIEKLKNLKDTKVDVYLFSSEFVQKSMSRSHQNLRKGHLNQLISPKPNFEGRVEAFEEKFKVLQNSIQSYFDLDKELTLNEEQAKALYAICTSSHQSHPFILWGPPGTGKTHTIVASIRVLLEMHQDTRILLTAPSNSAADLLALKILEVFPEYLIEKAGVLRLYSVTSDISKLDPKLKDISFIHPETNNFDVPTFTEFQFKRIVICTLATATHIVNEEIPQGFFSHIIVDEAGQATEPALWIPLSLATEKTSVILCGDHKQLGPSYCFDLKYETKKKFGSPLLRYMENYGYQSDPRLFIQLTQSYRCHSKILSIASELFYENQLVDQIVNREEPFANRECLKQQDTPILFVDVEGQQKQGVNGKSYANDLEINAVLAYVNEILKVPGIQKSDIGIVSPYRYQLCELSNALKNIDEEKEITIDTAEGFQGSERKVIILSTVRTEGLGFMDCPLRLNTSITRSQNLLIVIGHKQNLTRNNGPCKDFVNNCAEKGLVVEWTGSVPMF